MKIGIIGGGVGGLAVAWCLHEQATANKQEVPEIHIFEKNDRFGGNADTRQFDFGTGPGHEDKPLIRWADMGVNDFNTASKVYQKIVDVMTQIGYTKENGNYRNLEDSTTYYDTKGQSYFTANSYTKDVNGKKTSVQDPWWGTAMDKDLHDSVDSFMLNAGKDGGEAKFHDYTMEEYINEMSPHYKWSEDLGPKVIYPRVNGMYFTSGPLGPRQMPFAAVMHYYKIQEGAGGVPADRNYFVGGASTWIDALVDYMKKNMPQITFHENFNAMVGAQLDGKESAMIWNTTEAEAGIMVDKVVLAAPANHALRAMGAGTLANGQVSNGLPPVAANIMAQIKYETAVSVAHTDCRLMPVNRNAWSTYNIVIHEPDSVALKPYVINYVANRHQNDAASDSGYDTFGLPEFFLSINPHIPIDDDKVLKDIHGNAAKANLSHFVFDKECMQAQADIVEWQGHGGIYYASGWTNGSGLHGECWAQGQDVAAMILKSAAAGKHIANEPADRRELITSRLNAAAPCA